MLGTLTLLVALCVKIGFFIYRAVTKNYQMKKAHIIRLTAFATFTLLLLTRVYWWGFRWMGLFVLLLVLAIFSVNYFIKRPKVEKDYKGLRAVLSCISGCALLTLSILPGILFPQTKPVTPSGSYIVDTTSVTLVDAARTELFSEAGENRKLTIQFWYPVLEESRNTFPLVVFSHGSFGYRGSNLSTFENLASNGYVVCSIDHSYHAFFSKHTDGSTTLVNREFVGDAISVTNGEYDQPSTFQKTHEWLALRTADMDFVLDEIIKNKDGKIPESIYSMINEDEIGLFGHSLGGAAAAQLGREQKGVDAVIVIDGTMIGEALDYSNGQNVLNTEPYPVPLLNLYNESHYEDAKKLGETYNNLFASAHGIEAYDVVIRGSGHLNFTDLPLFSPTLAAMLGIGEVDSRYCIETMNQVVLDFFDYALKDADTLGFKAEY